MLEKGVKNLEIFVKTLYGLILPQIPRSLSINTKDHLVTHKFPTYIFVPTCLNERHTILLN